MQSITVHLNNGLASQPPLNFECWSLFGQTESESPIGSGFN